MSEYAKKYCTKRIFHYKFLYNIGLVSYLVIIILIHYKCPIDINKVDIEKNSGV